ncbi:hypothetical protein VTO73DRAFT_3200 [Trametes versicolor]
MASLRSNGRPEPEVIANFLDGHSYSKGKLEEVFRTLRLDKPYPKPARAPPSPYKAEDIDLLVQEFEITRAQAEKALAEVDGNVVEALRRMVTL